MPRELPAGLSDHHRDALLQFYHGHLSAGQLSERLGLRRGEDASSSRPPAAGATAIDPTVTFRRNGRLATRALAMLAAAIAGGSIGATLGPQLLSARPHGARADTRRLSARRRVAPAHNRARPKRAVAGVAATRPAPPAASSGSGYSEVTAGRTPSTQGSTAPTTTRSSR